MDQYIVIDPQGAYSIVDNLEQVKEAIEECIDYSPGGGLGDFQVYRLTPVKITTNFTFNEN
jgi:hypothetical protein